MGGLHGSLYTGPSCVSIEKCANAPAFVRGLTEPVFRHLHFAEMEFTEACDPGPLIAASCALPILCWKACP